MYIYVEKDMMLKKKTCFIKNLKFLYGLYTK